MQFHTTNWQGNAPGRAAAVVKPANTEEVTAIVKLCNQHNVKIVPQGGLTGLMTAGIPVRQGDEIVVSLARMNRILDVNPQAYTMTVEVGRRAADHPADGDGARPPVPDQPRRAGLVHDRRQPLDQCRRRAVLHYGNTRSMVLGLEVVLPDGRVWDGMRALKKDNTGYDLKDLFVGAEGTLGIITRRC